MNAAEQKLNEIVGESFKFLQGKIDMNDYADRVLSKRLEAAQLLAAEQAANVRTARKLAMTEVDFDNHPPVRDGELLELVAHPEKLESVKKRIWDYYGAVLLAKRRNVFGLPSVEALRFFRDKRRELATAMAERDSDRVKALIDEMRAHPEATGK